MIDEASRGDPQAAQRRMEYLRGLPEITANERVALLAKSLIREHALPPKAHQDAVHIALCAVHGIDYLATWNCKHMANAVMQWAIRDTIMREGLEAPLICTPNELLGEYRDVE